MAARERRGLRTEDTTMPIHMAAAHTFAETGRHHSQQTQYSTFPPPSSVQHAFVPTHSASSPSFTSPAAAHKRKQTSKRVGVATASDDDFQQASGCSSATPSPAAPSPGKPQSQKSVVGEPRRSAGEALSDYASVHTVANAHELPVGPFPGLTTSHDLKVFVKRRTLDTNTMGGGFGVRVLKTRHAHARMGSLAEFCCTNKERNGCKFYMAYELTTDGWLLGKVNPGHVSGCLKLTQAQVMAHSSGRYVPEEYEELGAIGIDAGLSPSEVYHLLLAKSRRDGVTNPHFTYQSIYDKFARISTAEKQLDVSGLLERLAVRKAESQLEYFTETDRSGRLKLLFVECRHGKDLWGTTRTQNFIGNVLVFDPTFGTNCYGMKFSMFVSVSGEGESRVIAYLVHFEESYEDIFWGFRCFQTVFRIPPVVLITDSGAGIQKAAEQMTSDYMPWYQTRHHLCTYHMDQNFYTHVRPLFAASTDGWKYVHTLFWELAKDSNRELTFGTWMSERFAHLRSYISEHGRGGTKPKVLEWFDSTFEAKHEKWVAAFTWSYFSAGCHASSRGESMNSHVKAWLLKNSRLLDLDIKLDQYIQFKEFRDACKHEAFLFQESSRMVTRFPSWLLNAKPCITSHAWRMAVGQLAQHTGYDVHPVPDDDVRSDKSRYEKTGTNFLVTAQHTDIAIKPPPLAADGRTKKEGYHVSTDVGFGDSAHVFWVRLGVCECQYATSHGVECRHSMAVRLRNSELHVPFLQTVAERWHTRKAEETVAAPRGVPEDSGPVTDCYVSLERVLQINGFQAADVSDIDSVNIKEYEGEYIMIKYGRKNQGGWHLARLMDHGGDDDEMGLYFHHGSKEENADWICDTALMIHPPMHHSDRHASRSWFFVQQRNLPQHTMASNPELMRSGRPQSKRKRPASGGPLR